MINFMNEANHEEDLMNYSFLQSTYITKVVKIKNFSLIKDAFCI